MITKMERRNRETRERLKVSDEYMDKEKTKIIYKNGQDRHQTQFWRRRLAVPRSRSTDASLIRRTIQAVCTQAGSISSSSWILEGHGIPSAHRS